MSNEMFSSPASTVAIQLEKHLAPFVKVVLRVVNNVRVCSHSRMDSESDLKLHKVVY